MKTGKRIISALICAAMIFGFAACGEKSQNNNTEPVSEQKTEVKTDINVACLKGPTGVGMVRLMSQAEDKKTVENYNFTVAAAADEISGKIVSGEINIASVPTNLAAKLYNKTQGRLVMLTVNTLGVLSVIEDGNSVKSVSDLKGKTIYSTGEGSNPEYILRYILSENGIDPDRDVKIRFVATNDELTAALVSSKAQIAMVPEPAATAVLSKKDTLNRVLNINDEWKKVSESSLMMGCIVALKSYVDENPKKIKKFLEEYEASVNFAKSNINEASQLCEKYGIIPNAKIAASAIPECGLAFVRGDEMKASLQGYFNVLINADPTSIGGKLPGDDFYYYEK